MPRVRDELTLLGNESFRFLRREIEEDIFAKYQNNLNARLNIYSSFGERDPDQEEEETEAKGVLAEIFEE